MGNRELASFLRFAHVSATKNLQSSLIAPRVPRGVFLAARFPSGAVVVDAVAVAAATASNRAYAVIRRGDEHPPVCAERASASSLAAWSHTQGGLVGQNSESETFPDP